jgi:23S rRNA (adenine2030-N6)-methyltransferase
VKYRHAFHAGNFADVHKHVTLLACLLAVTRKDKGFLYAETHAGAGIYDLRSHSAREASEADGGIGRLRTAGAADEPLLQRYLQLIDECRRRSGEKHAYPGSPWIAAALLRAQDRAVLHEIDAADCAALARMLEPESRCTALQADGYRGLRALLPPRERRALILIDPPYEDGDSDRRQVCSTLEDALRRFATGVYLLWYPLKLAAERDRWLQQLSGVVRAAEPNAREWLCSELWVHALDSRASLAGSGMFIVNPPFQLGDALRNANAELAKYLAGPQGGWNVCNTL